jgi:hypothetical protein
MKLIRCMAKFKCFTVDYNRLSVKVFTSREPLVAIVHKKAALYKTGRLSKSYTYQATLKSTL